MPSSIQIYSYSACSTCKKALSWLDLNNVEHDLFDIVKNPPSKDILKEAMKQFGSRKPLFNTSGVSYRSIGAKVINAMSDEEALESLASDGKLIKRPFLIFEGGQVLVGFKPEVWSEALLR